MSMNGISNLNGCQQVYNRKSKDNSSNPPSFKANGYVNDSYSSSVASEYIKKQQLQQQQKEYEKQKKEKWKQFGMDVLKYVTAGTILLGGAALYFSCTKAGKEMAQTMTNHLGLKSADGSNKLEEKFANAKPKVKREEVLEGISQMPISGSAKKACRNSLISANADAVSSIESLKKPTSSGILLYGLPGVGKSYSAKQLAEIFGAKVAELDVNNFKDAYVGESTKNIDRQILPIINEALEHPETPYFIIMDEADALLADTNDSSGTNNEMRSIFLQRMDAENLPPNLKYILTTNFPEKITPAAIRTGRLQAIKINNPKYDNLKKIYQDFINKEFGNKLENKDDLKSVIDDISSRYPLLGPAHTKAVKDELVDVLFASNTISKGDLENAFKAAHARACEEFFKRCNAMEPSVNTTYDVDKSNIEASRNIAKTCLLQYNRKYNENTIEILAHNIPIELMPRAISYIKDTENLTLEEIGSVISILNAQNFNISLPMDDLQAKIDEAAEEIERKEKECEAKKAA